MKLALNLNKVKKEGFSSLGEHHHSYMLEMPKNGHVPVRNFAFLYSDTNVYSITWDGDIDFSRIHQIALGSLPDALGKHRLDGQYDSFGDNHHRSVLVNMILRNNAGKKLVSFNFTEEEDLEAYYQRLVDFSLISFIRYDVAISLAETKFEFSFTAINPNAKHLPSAYTTDLELKIFPEIGFMLPICTPFSKHLLKWIVERHNYIDACKAHINYDKSVQAIQNCLNDIILDKRLKTEEKICDTF